MRRGIFAESIARQGAKLVAIDPSEKSLKAARDHARKEGLDIDYRHAFAESFKIPSSST
jgi:2-polyprenyl-6-hydroxyphenyl methylase/3-demethylubiquinone-9 3-methyltransferase